jgi:hypothetical protein
MTAAEIGAGLRLSRRDLPRGSRGFVLGGVRLRLRVKRRAFDLDRKLAAGVDPMESDDLSLRVGQLGSRESRRRLASALRSAVVLAGTQSASVALQSGAIEIQTNRALLLELAKRVADRLPVGVQGLARASLLVSDPASRLYRDDRPGPLADAALEALEALDRGHLTS